MNRRLWTLCIMAPLLPGCSTEEPPERSITLSANYLTTTPLIEDEHRNLFILDTGSTRTQLRPRMAGLPDDTFAERSLPGWDPQGFYDGVSQLIFSDRHEVQWSAWPIQPLGGFIGADLLAQARIAFDSRGERVFIGAFNAEALDVVAGVAVPVERVGAGTTCVKPGACYSYGPSRLVFDIDIEGVTARAILDTGSPRLALSPHLLASLPVRADRPIRRAALADRTYLTLSRAHVRVGAATLPNVIVQSDESDAKFLKLEVDTGERIDALVGSSFINAFVTAVDYEAPSLTLYPYRSLDHIDGNVGHGIGMMITHEEHCFRVIGVDDDLPAAMAGIVLGDCIVGIDEKTPETTELFYMSNYIRHVPLGTLLHVRVARSGGEEVFDVPTVDFLPPMKS